MILFAASKYGNIKIGGPDALPEFNTFSWYAMLISAGMGIGLMFWSVAEPIFHYTNPSPMFSVAANTPQAFQSVLGVTYFHWGWWISWSPFVGMFIARVSKGRTVREFIVGVMVLPTLLSFLWMSVLGGSALHLQSMGLADIASAVEENVSTALFVMLENFPLTEVTSFVGVLLVTIFFYYLLRFRFPGSGSPYLGG
jgi:choline-glycine betaine transporter